MNQRDSDEVLKIVLNQTNRLQDQINKLKGVTDVEALQESLAALEEKCAEYKRLYLAEARKNQEPNKAEVDVAAVQWRNGCLEAELRRLQGERDALKDELRETKTETKATTTTTFGALRTWGWFTIPRNDPTQMFSKNPDGTASTTYKPGKLKNTYAFDRNMIVTEVNPRSCTTDFCEKCSAKGEGNAP